MSGHLHFYDAFGQCVASDRALPWASTPPCAPSVRLISVPSPLAEQPQAQTIHRFEPPLGSPERPLRITLNPDQSLDLSDPIGCLRLNPDRQEVTVYWPEDLQSSRWLAVVLEHVALPLLWLRAKPDGLRVLLHASAVVVGGRAFVFMGSSGLGKSSTARALLPFAQLLADDLALIDVQTREVWPGSGSVRLWDHFQDLPHDAAFALLRDGDHVKQWLRVPSAQRARAPAPLGALVCLRRDPLAPTTGSLSRIDINSASGAALALLEQALSLTAPPFAWQAARFRAVCALARVAPVWTLTYAPSEAGEPLHVEALHALWTDPPDSPEQP